MLFCPIKTAMKIGAHLLLLLFVSSAFAQSASDAQSCSQDHYPRLIHADVPFYPPIAASAHFGGKVEIQITVAEGVVKNSEVINGTIEPQLNFNGWFPDAAREKLLSYLVGPSLENLKSWKFLSDEEATFTVTYLYQIRGEQTLQPENPQVEMNLPCLIRIVTRPVKPTTN